MEEIPAGGRSYVFLVDDFSFPCSASVVYWLQGRGSSRFLPTYTTRHVSLYERPGIL